MPEHGSLQGVCRLLLISLDTRAKASRFKREVLHPFKVASTRNVSFNFESACRLSWAFFGLTLLGGRFFLRFRTFPGPSCPQGQPIIAGWKMNPEGRCIFPTWNWGCQLFHEYVGLPRGLLYNLKEISRQKKKWVWFFFVHPNFQVTKPFFQRAVNCEKTKQSSGSIREKQKLQRKFKGT